MASKLVAMASEVVCPAQNGELPATHIFVVLGFGVDPDHSKLILLM